MSRTVSHEHRGINHEKWCVSASLMAEKKITMRRDNEAETIMPL